ncbi:MAG TPA: magnesium transporter [Candidatus Paceibacterota bacterium]
MNRVLSDNARALTYRPEERMAVFRTLTLPERSAAFAELSPYLQQTILQSLKEHEIIALLDHMDMRQVERIVARLSNRQQRQRIIRKLKGDIREKVDYFLRFHPDATLSHINFNYLFLSSSTTIGDAADIIDENYTETGRYPEILVHQDGKLIGEVPFASMVRERNSNTLKRYVLPVETITYQASVAEIFERVVSTNSRKIVVLDTDTSVLGIIYAESLRPLFGKLPAESLYEFTGVDNSERPFDSVGKKVGNRYRWLILNLATCFLAGSVILSFQDTLDKLTILSVYIPIIAGMGGNAAAQSFAIMVRGITLGTITLSNAWPALRREMIAGAINGVIIGTIVALISAVWNGQPLLGLAVGLAHIGAHITAALAGSIIPLIMKRFGKDPAATSSIFITTVTDVGGLMLLFGIATLILL